MELNWLESIIYAFISGITEFLPVSSRAHQAMMLQMFGRDSSTVILNLLIHISLLLAVFLNCQNQIQALRRTQRLLMIPARRRKRQPEREQVAKFRLIRTASIPVLIFTVFFQIADLAAARLQIVAICLVLNGVMLYITGHIALGNKDASHLTGFDGILIGLVSGLGILPGFSRLGLGTSVSVMRGASTKDALDWALLISIPALIGLCIADMILIFTAGVGTVTFLMVLQFLVSALAACIGAYLAIAVMRFMAVKIGFSVFACYCWGIGLFSFILFMI